MDSQTRWSLRLFLAGLFVLAHFIAWEGFLRPHWTEREMHRAAVPGRLAETRAQLDARLRPFGWNSQEIGAGSGSGQDQYVTVEYRRWPGLYFDLHFLNGRVLCYDPVE